MITTDLWPMTLLTRPVGEKDRALLVHPKPSIDRKGLSKDGDRIIVDESCIKIKKFNYLYVEEKSQGHRHLFARDKYGNYSCYGRRLNVQNTYTDIWPKISSMPHPELPKETVIDMELIWPGHPDSEVTTAIAEHPEELRMRCFAVPIYKGNLQILENSLEYPEGRNQLIDLVEKDNAVKSYSPMDFTQSFYKLTLEKYLNYAQKNSLEGFVLKQKSCLNWFKLKVSDEADVFIMGFKISNAETRKGMVTAVKVGVMKNGKETYIGNVAGWNLEEMGLMTEFYNKYGNDSPFIHKVIKIQYQELASKSGLRHAQKFCFRDDKNYQSCTWDQFV